MTTTRRADDRQVITDLIRAAQGSNGALHMAHQGNRPRALEEIDYALANLNHAKQLLTEKD